MVRLESVGHVGKVDALFEGLLNVGFDVRLHLTEKLGRIRWEREEDEKGGEREEEGMEKREGEPTEQWKRGSRQC